MQVTSLGDPRGRLGRGNQCNGSRMDAGTATRAKPAHRGEKTATPQPRQAMMTRGETSEVHDHTILRPPLGNPPPPPPPRNQKIGSPLSPENLHFNVQTICRFIVYYIVKGVRVCMCVCVFLLRNTANGM